MKCRPTSLLRLLLLLLLIQDGAVRVSSFSVVPHRTSSRGRTTTTQTTTQTWALSSPLFNSNVNSVLKQPDQLFTPPAPATDIVVQNELASSTSSRPLVSTLTRVRASKSLGLLLDLDRELLCGIVAWCACRARLHRVCHEL
jgi:hypothetical protein